MGIFAFQQSNNASGPVEMFRGEVDASGDPIFDTTERSTYVVPTRGEYRLKVTGFSLPWEEEKKKEYQKEGQSTMTTKTHLELEIADGRGKGKRFLWSFQRGQQVFFEDMFGHEFIAYVVPSDTVDDKGKPRYATLARETIKPVLDIEEDDPFADEEAGAA
jgi:hypothetical protein